MPEPSELFRPVALDVEDVALFHRSSFVREWIRYLRSEIYQRSQRRSKDEGEFRERQGFVDGLRFALSLPQTILAEMSNDKDDDKENDK